MATRYISNITYKPSQQVESIALNNGVTETFGYSADRLQLTSQTVTKTGSGTLMSLGYNYVGDSTRNGGTQSGNTGQLMDITSGSQSNGQAREETYSYDGVGRLVTASGWNNTWQRRYEYDRFGNRTAVYNATTGGSQLQSLSLQTPGGGVTNNRLNSVTTNGTIYNQTYDPNGNILNDGIHTYKYDAENRVVRIDEGLTNDSTFVYDSANRRVKKNEQGYTTNYIWEGSSVIAEYSNRPQTSVGGRKFYHPDRLSNRLITDSAGAVKGASDSLPFGDEGGRSGEGEKHRYTSYERDRESGTDYAVNRQYSQVTGRFGRPDPIAGSPGNPQSLNRYSYATDPVNASDPSGLFSEGVWMLYAGTFLGAGGRFGGGADYAFWGDRIVDLPGFGTMWGSMSEYSEWQWNNRLRNTFDRAAAERAWNRGNYARVSSILKGNPNVGLSVGGVSFWGELGAAFAEGYGEAALTASMQTGPIDPIRSGLKKVIALLRGPDFFIINGAGIVQFSVAVVRGGRLPDDIVASIGASTGLEVSAFAGWILQLKTPATADVTSFLTGYSWSWDVFFNPKTGVGAGIGPAIMRSPNAVGNKWAFLVGGGVGGGIANGWGFTYADLLKWFKGRN